MRLIARDTDYALKSLCYLAQHGRKVVSVTELITALHIPRAFLRKVLQTLSRRGYLRSYRGQGGGFSLRRAPVEIRVMDIVDIFQEDWHADPCFIAGKICPERSSCVLRRKIRSIEQSVTGELYATSLKELIAHQE